MAALFDNISLALESLRMNKMRALLTMLGIIIGIGSVIAISTVGTSLSSSINSSMSSLGAANITVSLTQKSSDSDDSDNSDNDVKTAMFASSTPSDSDLITQDMIDEYKSAFADSVKYIELTDSCGTATVTNESDSSEESSVNLIGANDEYADAEELEVTNGRFVDNAKDSERRVCVVSDYFAENTLNCAPTEAVGKKISLTLNDNIYDFYIEGVYIYEQETSTTDEDTDVTTDIYIPTAQAKAISGSGEGWQSITVIAQNVESTTDFMNTTGDFFASYYTQNTAWTVEASSLEQMLSTVTEIISTVSAAIAAIAAISLLVGGIGVMNIMLVSITERTKEIGTRKALGATNSSIRRQFITESIVICLIGGVVGIILGVVLGLVISKIIGFTASPSVGAIVISVAFSMLIGVIFGYAPANKAAKLDPIDALRYE